MSCLLYPIATRASTFSDFPFQFRCVLLLLLRWWFFGREGGGGGGHRHRRRRDEIWIRCKVVVVALK